ncbi:MAG: UDP-2,3-diacylglucosamine diphosphatase [Chloroflexi bacterium]|nr:UDP-2,3-diacylglucosamine diphosphatase [Chloroflexota bacterium]
MRAIFIADAHLRHPQDSNYQKLLDFLDQQKNLDGLFLLGDIFEFWIGYKHLVFSAYIPLLEKLRRLTNAGTKLYFVEGNHDFHLGPYFTDTLGCTVIPDQQLVEFDGKKLLLCHGDLLNPSKNYQRLRTFLRSGLIRFLARIVHPDPVWAFAIRLSDLSRKKNPDSRNANPTPLLRTFAESGTTAAADTIVCGHFHQPISIVYNNKQVLVVGDWITQFSYLEMVNGRLELKTF